MVEGILKYEHRLRRDFLRVYQMLGIQTRHEIPGPLAAAKLYTDQDITNHLSSMLEVASRNGR
jgi:hypothetical protein